MLRGSIVREPAQWRTTLCENPHNESDGPAMRGRLWPLSRAKSRPNPRQEPPRLTPAGNPRA